MFNLNQNKNKNLRQRLKRQLSQDQYLKTRMNDMNGICKTGAFAKKTDLGLQITLNQMNIKKYIRN